VNSRKVYPNYLLSAEAMQEVNLYASAKSGRFTLSVCDYFTLKDSIGAQNSYSKFDSKPTAHLL